MKFKNTLGSAFDYFVFGNIFISLCAVVMFLQVKIVFSLIVDSYFFPFIFCSTLCSYSLHWSLTSYPHPVSGRLKWTMHHRKLLIALCILAFIGTLIFFVPLLKYYKLLLPLAFITFMYTAPKIPVQPFLFIRKIAVLKTTYLTLVWVFTTSVLPVLVSGADWNISISLFTINRLFLIFPICILFDYRDREEDLQEGIKNIATNLSSRGLDFVFSLCMLINFICAVLFQIVYGNWFYTIALLVPALMLSFTYRISKNSKSDLWFYFYLDGLMMLSGLILLITRI